LYYGRDLSRFPLQIVCIFQKASLGGIERSGIGKAAEASASSPRHLIRRVTRLAYGTLARRIERS
jgi:hypothetical protein